MSEQLKKMFLKHRIFSQLKGTDYVEFYVGNAKQAAPFINFIWFSITSILGLGNRRFIKNIICFGSR